MLHPAPPSPERIAAAALALARAAGQEKPSPEMHALAPFLAGLDAVMRRDDIATAAALGRASLAAECAAMAPGTLHQQVAWKAVADVLGTLGQHRIDSIPGPSLHRRQVGADEGALA